MKNCSSHSGNDRIVTKIGCSNDERDVYYVRTNVTTGITSTSMCCVPEAETYLDCRSNVQSAIHTERSPTPEESVRTVISNVPSKKDKSSKDLKLSFGSLVSTNIVKENKVKKYTYEVWLAKKNLEKKKREKQQKLLKECILEEQNKKTARGTQVFLNWLAAKKEEEKMKKCESQLKKEELKRIAAEKREMRRLSELEYELWLNRKIESEYEKKMEKLAQTIKELEERKAKAFLNETAYNKWLQNLKDKPKPNTSNQGLHSSISVTYINPKPWIPNIQTSKSCN